MGSWFEVILLVNQTLVISSQKDLRGYFSFTLDYTSSFFHFGKVKFWVGMPVWWIRAFHTHFLSSVTIQICLWGMMISVLLKTLLLPSRISIQMITTHQASMWLNMICLNIMEVWKYILYQPCEMHWCTILINLLTSQDIFGEGHIYQTWWANHHENGHGQ